MAEVVNLRLARKAKRRAQAEMTATANRAAFGRSKAQRDDAAAQVARLGQALDGAKREP